MKLVIMRGVSGAGKSTKAKEIVKDFLNSRKKKNLDAVSIICSADKFFIDHASGKYNFDHKQIGMAHAWCKGNVNAAMELETDLIVLDNTNTQKWEYQAYIDMAKHYGYSHEIVTVGKLDEQSLKEYANRNVHGVPLEAIKRMAKRFEQ